MDDFYVYTHADPRTGEIRYIGERGDQYAPKPKPPWKQHGPTTLT